METEIHQEKDYVLKRTTPLDSEQAKEFARLNPRARGKKRKYGILQLDEAVKLAKEVGLKEAELLTGVKRETIRKHDRAQRVAAGERMVAIPRFASQQKYTLQQKRECIALAKKYHDETNSTFSDCCRRAAAVMQLPNPAVAGASISKQYALGLLGI